MYMILERGSGPDLKVPHFQKGGPPFKIAPKYPKKSQLLEKGLQPPVLGHENKFRTISGEH